MGTVGFGGSMNLVVNAALLGLVSALLFTPDLLAQASREGAPRIDACALLSKEEIKRHLPWNSILDQIPIEEEQVGATGSGCEYPSVRVQVLSFSQGMMDQAKKKDQVEAIDGVGDEAYLYNNRDLYAELVVRVGDKMLTLQASIDDTMESVKPGVLSLANALAAQLR